MWPHSTHWEASGDCGAAAWMKQQGPAVQGEQRRRRRRLRQGQVSMPQPAQARLGCCSRIFSETGMQQLGYTSGKLLLLQRAGDAVAAAAAAAAHLPSAGGTPARPGSGSQSSRGGISCTHEHMGGASCSVQRMGQRPLSAGKREDHSSGRRSHSALPDPPIRLGGL